MKNLTPRIKIIDDMHPEDVAMLQALYSRSPASVDDHLDSVEAAGSGNFMDKWYVGYGHKSIADCGSTTLFVEGVPMTIAKAIQQWPLYNGQEASTRYLDFGEVAFLNPVGTPEGAAIQEKWREFYVDTLPEVRDHVVRTHPNPLEGESAKAYERAVNCRAFDIMRAWLPAGAVTNLSWHTNLRQADDHLVGLLGSPDSVEVEAGEALFDALATKYRHTFRRPSDEALAWARRCREVELGSEPDLSLFPQPFDETNMALHVDLRHPIDHPEVVSLLRQRPRGMPVPRFLERAGVIRSAFQLDYGSWRDLQRHRNGFVSMPRLEPTRIHDWYLQALPDGVRDRALTLFEEQKAAIRGLPVDRYLQQHYVPMGCLMMVSVTQSLPAWVYRVELRSSRNVHPTLRAATLKEAETFKLAREGAFAWMTLHVDDSPDEFNLRRGDQTITPSKE